MDTKDIKKVAKALLFPHIAILIILLPVAIGGMMFAMLRYGESHIVTIAFYVLAFYTVAVWSLRIPSIIKYWKNFKNENKYTSRWFGDYRLRTNIILSGNVIWNGAYGALQLGMGIYHHSAWFYSLAGYYACLAVMRFFLVKHTLKYEPGKDRDRERVYYRVCGWVFLIMNLALSGMMLYMIRENRVTIHSEITTIALAAYTFFTLTMAIIGVFKYRKYNSPVMSASRAVSLAAACVSMLSLENTMLTTFGSELSAADRQLFLALSGGAISVFIVVMAIYMIINSSKKLKIKEIPNGKQQDI